MKRLRLTLLLVLPLAAPSLLTAQDTSCGIAWGPIINLSGSDPNAAWPHIAVQGETLHVTWWGGGFRLPYRRSVDGGVTWEPTREMISDTTIHFAYYPWIVANSRTAYFVFGGTTAAGTTPVCVMKSEDRGTTWGAYDSINAEHATQIRNVSLREDTLVVQYPRPSPLSTFRFFISTNGGTSWDSSNVTTLGPVDIGGGFLHNVWGQVFVGHGQEVVYKRSVDLGESWQDSSVLSSLDDEWSHDAKIAISEDVPPRLYVTWRDSKNGCLTLVGCSIIMRMSGDGGLTWGDEYWMTDTPVGYNWDWGKQIATCGQNVIAVWTNDQTGHINMRYSVDRGDAWSVLCDVTPGGRTTDPSCAMTRAAAHVVWEEIDTNGTGGVRIYYRRGVILQNPVEPQPELPGQCALLQNYPNPFNSSTELRFTLPGPATVSLALYDLLGRKIADLASGSHEAGYHKVVWNAADKASGVYLARFSAMNALGNAVYTRTNKLVLIR